MKFKIFHWLAIELYAAIIVSSTTLVSARVIQFWGRFWLYFISVSIFLRAFLIKQLFHSGVLDIQHALVE